MTKPAGREAEMDWMIILVGVFVWFLGMLFAVGIVAGANCGAEPTQTQAASS